MGLSCGLVGIASCGKTTIFNAMTAAGVASYGGAEMNHAVVNVPDQRLIKFAEMYHPLKLVPSSVDIVDIPGLKADTKGSGKGFRLLAQIKNVEVMLHVVRCFEDPNVPFEYQTIDPVRDVETVDLELMAADSTTLQNKITRLEKKVRTGEKDAIRESAVCDKVFKAIQEGTPARRLGLNAQEMAAVYECNLVSMKPVLYIANVKTVADSSNKHVAALKDYAKKENAEAIVVCGKDEADISQLPKEEQQVFLKDLGLNESSIERVLKAANHLLGLINFFTVGEDEVRAWTCRKGDKAPAAAGKIHSDMEKGFIRMEVMRAEDLIGLGSEAAAAKAGKQRVEGRDYVVQDGDVVMVRFSR